MSHNLFQRALRAPQIEKEQAPLTPTLRPSDVVTAGEYAARRGCTDRAANQRLGKLVRHGLAWRLGHGLYRIPADLMAPVRIGATP